MKMKKTLMKRAMRSALLVLLLAGMGKVNAQDLFEKLLSNATESADWIEQPNRGDPPIATTLSATNVTANSATLRATINPNGSQVAYVFNYGTSTSYGNNSEAGTLNVGFAAVQVSITVSGLSPGTTYHFRIKAVSNYGVSYGSDKTFTTLSSGNSAPNTPSNPNPSNGATGIATSRSFSWNCTDPDGDDVGYELYLGTSMNGMSLYRSGNGTSAYVSGLSEGQKYYWRIIAYDEYDLAVTGPIWNFTTLSNDPPTTPNNPSPSNGATGVSTNPTLSWSCSDPEGGSVGYDVFYGTSSSSLSNHVGGTGTSTTLSGLSNNQTYYWKVVAYDQQNNSTTGPIWHFTTGAGDCFDDCTSSSCGDYGSQMYDAAQYLCNLDIVEGINYNLEPDISITRAQLAKVALYSLYNGPSNVPNPLVSDYFPSIYADLQDNTTYYYRAAKALLYLEYGDGVSPFDRDRAVFDPEGYIQRCFVLKVLLETFNIAPLTSGTNVFDDFGPSGYDNSGFWGYAQKAYNLNIVQTTHFRPDDYCTRGEVFLYLYRILSNSNITKPTPVNTESPATSDFFIPANLSPEVVNAMRGVEYGNFNYYEKDFFTISGYMDLDFGIAYNSYLTEMPSDLYPIQPLGKAWTHTYDMYMNIVTDSYNNNSVYVFHMKDGALLIYTNVNGTMTSLTEGNYYELSTSGSNKYILKATDQVSYTFERKSTSDGIYYLTQIKDRNNNAIDITYSYGNSHYRISSVSTIGRTLNFYYNSGTDLLSSVKDPINRQVYFYYDADCQLSSLKDAKNQTTSFSYGTLYFEKGLLKEITLPRGNKVYNNYQQRKLTSTKYNNDIPTTVSITPSYQNGSTTSTVTQPVDGSQSIITTYTMNADSRITRLQDSNNKDISFSYNNSSHASLVSQMIDNKTNTQISYTYSDKGMMTGATTSAGGQTITTTFTYNSNNDITSFKDANNNTTHYYYTNGNLTSIVDALGNTTTYTNNSHGSPTQVTNAMGVTTTYQYNDYGNVTNIAIPAMNLTGSFTYDGVSRVASKTDMGGNLTSYSYDANDNVLTETDALNNVTTYVFDANDNVTQITNAKGYSTLMTYDNNDFVTTVTFQNATKNYAYNTDGTLKTYTDPNGHVFNYTYNDSGNLLGDGYATYSYNNKGQLISVTKDSKPIQYTYDALSRVTSVAYDGNTVSYAYDNNGNIISITYPGNKTVTYTYDALNRMTSVKDWNNATTTYSYRNDGQLYYYQYPNNVRTTYGYDNSGRCTSQTTRRNNGNGTTIASYDYTLNSIGSHTQESISEPFENYPDIPSENLSYSYNNANRLLSVGSFTFNYDNNGNVTSRTGRNYTYDAKNNLSEVSGDFTASYSYDGYGYRRSSTKNGVTKNYVLDIINGNGNVLMETGGSGTIYYIYGANGLISRINSSNETSYYIYDFRGSTVAMTDASTSANVTHKYQYDDFGKVLQSEEIDANPFQYIGQFGVMYETEGLVYMRARYYDESIGRFLSEDPIWNVNLYPYAGNNPICNIDPSGNLFSEVLGGGFEIYKGVTSGASTVSNIAAAAKAKALGNAAQKVAGKEAEILMDNYLASEGTKTAVTVGAKTAGGKAAAGIGGSIGTTVAVGVGGAVIATGSCIWAHKLGAKGKKGAAYGVGVGGGALGGAMLGAAIGSVIPGVGTAVGAVIGGVIGGVAGYISARTGVKKYNKAEADWKNLYTL